MTRLTYAQITAAALPDWRAVGNLIGTRYATSDFETGAALVAAVARAADRAGHHPDITLTYPSVAITISTHDEGGVTDKDIDLAREISMAAETMGIAADPEAVQIVDLGLDTPDQSEIDRFWAAVLTGDADNVVGDSVVDPAGRAPLLWFQESEPHETPHQRFHWDVTLPLDQVETRTKAVLAEGGQIAWEEQSFRVLQDAQGNRACLCWPVD